MKLLLRFILAALPGLLWVTPAVAGSGVARCLVRDANGKARTAYVRLSDNRILYPQVVQKVAHSNGRLKYLPAISSAYRPGGFYGGYNGFEQGDGNGTGRYGLPGRWYYPVGTGYPGHYRSRTNYGVDSILYNGNRGKFGIPGYGLPGGAFPRPVVRPQSSVIQIPRYSGNVKGR